MADAARDGAVSPGSNLHGLTALLLVLGTTGIVACAEDPTLEGLERRWHFTFRSADDAAPQEEELSIGIDRDSALLTPLENGVSRIDLRRAGTVGGTPDSFTLDSSWPQQIQTPSGCSLESSRRTLRGRILEGRLSGSYTHRHSWTGAACTPPEVDESSLRGSFGAIEIVDS